MSQTREKQAVTLSEVTWRNRTVQVKSEPVRLFLLSVQESVKEVEKSESIDSKVSIYESLLKQCIDAQQVLRDSLQEDPVWMIVFIILKNYRNYGNMFCKTFMCILNQSGLVR